MSAISRDVKDKVRLDAKNRCGYCLTPQEILSMTLEIEHLHPIAGGGTNEEENLWLACRNCNLFKHAKTHAVDPQTNIEAAIFNPRRQIWSEHFEFSADKTEIIGTTTCGRATVVALRLNYEQAVNARKVWVNAGLYPPAI
ncbi:MAG: HNH endonuclease [Pyrinomonadaceae bacterium]